MGAAWLLFMPAAIVAMAAAIHVLWRDGAQARSRTQQSTMIRRACLRASVSGLLLTLSALYWMNGSDWPRGVVVMTLGLLTAAGGGGVADYLNHHHPHRHNQLRRQQPGPNRGNPYAG